MFPSSVVTKATEKAYQNIIKNMTVTHSNLNSVQLLYKAIILIINNNNM
jgi:hypothetical protein